MCQVKVGLVPVWTTVGYAEIAPSGDDGILDVVSTAAAFVGTKMQQEMTAADAAAKWLVFMAGVRVGVWKTAFHPEPAKRDLREMGGPVRGGAGFAGNGSGAACLFGTESRSGPPEGLRDRQHLRKVVV